VARRFRVRQPEILNSLTQVKVFNASVRLAPQQQGIIRKMADTMVSLKGENLRAATIVVLGEVKSGGWAFGGKSITTADVNAVSAGNAKFSPSPNDPVPSSLAIADRAWLVGYSSRFNSRPSQPMRSRPQAGAKAGSLRNLAQVGREMTFDAEEIRMDEGVSLMPRSRRKCTLKWMRSRSDQETKAGTGRLK